MKTRQSTRQYLARTLTLVAFVAMLGLATLGHARAADNDPSQNATTEIQVCEAMGGKATVYTDRHGDYLTVYVECKGGALDGFNCINDTGFNDCMFTRFDPDRVITMPKPGGIKPLDDVATTPIVAVEQPIEVAPDVQELPATPTPEPSPIIFQDPILTDPVMTDDSPATPTPDAGGEIITDPVLTDPVVNDGGVVTDAPADGGKIIDDIKIKDPSLLAPISSEPILIAPGQ